MNVAQLLRRLIDWFLGKAPSKLETFEEETIAGAGVTLIRYRRKTYRAYRTWRAVYKALEYDLIFGWDTLAYLPDQPTIHKQNRLSTHLLNIYRQGLHARFNPRRGVHEPDIESILKDQEVCLEAMYMPQVVTHWRLKSTAWEQPILEQEDVFDLIIDAVAKYAIDHPPGEIDPLQIDWRGVVEQKTRSILGQKGHQVFPDPTVRGWWQEL